MASELKIMSAGALKTMVEALGASHVGIGSDLHGLVRTIMPGYEEFAALEDELARRKLKDEDIRSVLGGNYVRVLHQALAALGRRQSMHRHRDDHSGRA